MELKHPSSSRLDALCHSPPTARILPPLRAQTILPTVVSSIVTVREPAADEHGAHMMRVLE